MISNKLISKIIFFLLFVSIFSLFYFTISTVSNNAGDSLIKPVNRTTNSNGDNFLCPAIKKRSCCQKTYCADYYECPTLPDECNSQTNLKNCSIYSWKDTSAPGLCRDCNVVSADSITTKTTVKCN